MNLPAAQDGQPKRWPGPAGGAAGDPARRRRQLLLLSFLWLASSWTVPLNAAVEQASPITGRAESSGEAAARPTADEPPELPAREPGACAIPGDDLAPTMVVIPPGRFLMGSPKDEAGRTADEAPRHWVTIPRPFALGRCEITVGQFRRFVEERHYQTSAEKPESKGCAIWNEDKKSAELMKEANWRNPGFAQTDQHPVVCISFEDAKAYAEWLSQRTGAVYRLPTEAEWEYAARAGTETARYWGEDPNSGHQCDYANGLGQEAKTLAGPDWKPADCSDAFVYTAPAASFRPNAFQLYDMLGNVFEWTGDCSHEDYGNAPADGSAWLDANGGDCSSRVVRGGSWFFNPRNLRSANRLRNSSDVAFNDLGFRLARDL